MRFRLQERGDASCRVKFSHMALAVVKAQGMQPETLPLGDRRGGG